MKNYTTLWRRAKTLDVELPIFLDSEPIHLVVYSIGLKVYGKGEGKVCASASTRSGVCGVKSISHSTRIWVKWMPHYKWMSRY
ncbi:MAG: hypothetical protein E5299_01314 [Burkholderia gladioli]|nr:MAG: hypothetical protein E5299_01314 [Burkholderia gladioli]